MAQDTLKIGINNELINLTPPKLNHKVDVIIEDSNYNYHINISKLDKSFVVANDTTLSLAKNPVKKKKYTSSLLNEAELGMSFIPNSKSHELMYGTRSDRDHISETFISSGTGNGFYGSVNIKSKRRMLTQSEKFYFGNATQIKFNQNFYQGSMEYREIFATTPNRLQDSVGRIDTFRAAVTIRNLFLIKRLSFGVMINPGQKFSIEYGLDVGVRLSNNVISEVYNTTGDFNERVYNAHVYTSPFVSNPLFILYHRIGINYKRFTLNAGVSHGKTQMGTHSYSEGRMANVGLAYRLR